MNIEQLKSDYEVFYDSKACPITSIQEYPGHLMVEFKYNAWDSTRYNINKDTLVALGYEREDSPVRMRKKARSVVRDVWAIRFGHVDWGKDDWIDVNRAYSIKEAQEILALHKQHLDASSSPFKVRLKKSTEQADVYDYDQWAAARFETGEWKRLPWADEPWFDKHPEHFAHHSNYDDTWVAFWPSATEAQADRVETMTAGRYLSRYYSDILTPVQIEQWVHKMDPPGDLVFSGKDPEAIYEAYDSNGGNMHSCMVYRDHQNCHDGVGWRSGKSPVRVYGGGDLEVVTLIRRGQAVARALCWPEKKAYGRCYGDIGRLKTALDAQGWEHDGGGSNSMDTYGRGLFNGARLLKIRPENYPNNWTMPYVDFHYNVADKGDHFILTRDSEGQKCWRTDGLMYQPDSCGCCANCGDDMDDEDETYTVDGNLWCYHCWDNNARSCDHCGHCTEHSLNDVGSAEYCDSCYDSHSQDCDVCDERTPNYDLRVVRNHREDTDYGVACSTCVGSDDVTRIGDTYYVTSTIEEQEDEHEPA